MLDLMGRDRKTLTNTSRTPSCLWATGRQGQGWSLDVDTVYCIYCFIELCVALVWGSTNNINIDRLRAAVRLTPNRARSVPNAFMTGNIYVIILEPPNISVSHLVQ